MTTTTQAKHRQTIEVPDSFWDTLVLNETPTKEYLVTRVWVRDIRTVNTRNGSTANVRDVSSEMKNTATGQQFFIEQSLWYERASTIGDQLRAFSHGKENLLTYDFNGSRDELVAEEYENNKGELCIKIKLPRGAYPFYRAQGLGKASSDNGVGFPSDSDDEKEEKAASPASSSSEID